MRTILLLIFLTPAISLANETERANVCFKRNGVISCDVVAVPSVTFTKELYELTPVYVGNSEAFGIWYYYYVTTSTQLAQRRYSECLGGLRLLGITPSDSTTALIRYSTPVFNAMTNDSIGWNPDSPPDFLTVATHIFHAVQWHNFVVSNTRSCEAYLNSLIS